MKAILLTLALTGCGFTVVDTGHRGVRTNFGEIIGQPLPEGLYFYNPFTSGVRELDVREEKLEGTTPCYTKDTQVAKIAYSLTYAPDPTKIHDLYRTIGEDWPKKIVSPIVQDAIQDVIGAVVADDLMAKREETRKHALDKIQEALQARSVTIRQLAFTNIDFDDAYEKAVENKVVAIQKAAEAKNKTVEITENAKQKVIAAEAEAKSMTIRSQALAQNHGLVEYEAVQKWDGKLPVQMLGNTLPFLDVGKK